MHGRYARSRASCRPGGASAGRAGRSAPAVSPPLPAALPPAVAPLPAAPPLPGVPDHLPALAPAAGGVPALPAVWRRLPCDAGGHRARRRGGLRLAGNISGASSVGRCHCSRPRLARADCFPTASTTQTFGPVLIVMPPPTANPPIGGSMFGQSGSQARVLGAFLARIGLSVPMSRKPAFASREVIGRRRALRDRSRGARRLRARAGSQLLLDGAACGSCPNHGAASSGGTLPESPQHKIDPEGVTAQEWLWAARELQGILPTEHPPVRSR